MATTVVVILQVWPTGHLGMLLHEAKMRRRVCYKNSTNITYFITIQLHKPDQPRDILVYYFSSS